METTVARRIATVTLGLAMLAGMAAARADERLWREQVSASGTIAVTVLKDEAQAHAHADYLWGAQVTGAQAFGVQIGWGASAAAPDYALWREQIAARRGADEAALRISTR